MKCRGFKVARIDIHADVDDVIAKLRGSALHKQNSMRIRKLAVVPIAFELQLGNSADIHSAERNETVLLHPELSPTVIIGDIFLIATENPGCCAFPAENRGLFCL